jgi:polyisoprenoid-binding protein YceI
MNRPNPQESRVTPIRFEFDSTRSCVWVNARSSIHPINTETRGLNGWCEVSVEADGSLTFADPIGGTLELAADLLSSGNQLYDKELKRRIDARRYPSIVGEITRVVPAAGADRYLVTGDLTFHGRTRSFTHDMSIVVRDGSIELKGEYIFDIREFNMKPPSMLMVKVYPEIAVRVELHGDARA